MGGRRKRLGSVATLEEVQDIQLAREAFAVRISEDAICQIRAHWANSLSAIHHDGRPERGESWHNIVDVPSVTAGVSRP